MKTVILVDDDIRHAEKLLQTVEAILISASKQVDGPRLLDMRIIYMHVINNEGNQADIIAELRKSFEKIIDRIKKRAGTKENMVDIEYIPVLLEYEQGIEKYGTVFMSELQKNTKKTNADNEYAILLDLILFAQEDSNTLATQQTGQDMETLSIKVYKEYRDNCLLYSSYPPKSIIEKWREIAGIAGTKEEPFQLSYIANGRAIYVPFQRDLLKLLKIGGSR